MLTEIIITIVVHNRNNNNNIILLLLLFLLYIAVDHGQTGRPAYKLRGVAWNADKDAVQSVQPTGALEGGGYPPSRHHLHLRGRDRGGEEEGSRDGTETEGDVLLGTEV